MNVRIYEDLLGQRLESPPYLDYTTEGCSKERSVFTLANFFYSQNLKRSFLGPRSGFSCNVYCAFTSSRVTFAKSSTCLIRTDVGAHDYLHLTGIQFHKGQKLREGLRSMWGDGSNSRKCNETAWWWH